MFLPPRIYFTLSSKYTPICSFVITERMRHLYLPIIKTVTKIITINTFDGLHPQSVFYYPYINSTWTRWFIHSFLRSSNISMVYKE